MPLDFDPTNPDLAEEVCGVCEEPASYAVVIAALDQQQTLMVCKVCEHYVERADLDALIARSPDPSHETDLLAERLITHRERAIPFELGTPDAADSWD